MRVKSIFLADFWRIWNYHKTVYFWTHFHDVMVWAKSTSDKLRFYWNKTRTGNWMMLKFVLAWTSIYETPISSSNKVLTFLFDARRFGCKQRHGYCRMLQVLSELRRVSTWRHSEYPATCHLLVHQTLVIARPKKRNGAILINTGGEEKSSFCPARFDCAGEWSDCPWLRALSR